MRIPTGAVLVVTLAILPLGGCGGPSSAPAVKYLDVGIDEDSLPVGISVLVQNSGNQSANLVSAKPNIGWKFLLAGKGDQSAAPPEFDYELIPPKDPDPLQAGAKQAFEFDFAWTVPPDAPPMLAIVHATFALTFDNGTLVETVPVTFVVRSRADVGVEGALSGQAKELGAKIRALPGWKSPNVEAIISNDE